MSDRPRHRAATLERRTTLLRAAVALTAERGVAGVTHRDVAARAGVSLGTTSYYFDSIDELVTEGLRLVVTEHIAAIEAVTAEIAGGAQELDPLVDRLVDILIASPAPHVLAQFENYLDAGRRHERRAEVTTILDAYERMAHVALEAVGADDPAASARAIVAISDGFALQRLVRGPGPDDRRQLRDALLSTLRTASVTP